MMFMLVMFVFLDIELFSVWLIVCLIVGVLVCVISCLFIMFGIVVLM